MASVYLSWAFGFRADVSWGSSMWWTWSPSSSWEAQRRPHFLARLLSVDTASANVAGEPILLVHYGEVMKEHRRRAGLNVNITPGDESRQDFQSRPPNLDLEDCDPCLSPMPTKQR
jgi:hypothetical protein